MEDQRRPSHAAGYPASADTKRGGNLAAADTEGGRALAAARRAQRRLGLRKSQRAPREIRPLPTVEAAGPSPPPTRSSDVPRDIRPQPTWRAAGPSPPTRSSDAPRDIQALSTPTAAGRRLPQGGPSAVSASGKASAHRGKSGLCRRWRPPGLAAADEKFGRSAGYSATTDLEGRRPFAAVKRD
ncbi:hypothetical protein HRG_008866 [Hirsutella rhossiliensis]|uniref:Uncharacterized protein n=1 Tax=Hirsutella rhossiliensis TaxID=111463 RepID=A0A9P8MIM5_9HYPO|nr:uncharacterized protein HRG_11858 [Hirsutella rhossiliensis]XP_044717358.1 uncharacterized protein HRG_08866 [Hirsutella rhossiliensis]KAH0957058.1 hypothetical protein HRG_11858 [Hirsutella rhossiliensis]KAH0959845.1 hypothetical protein HRG_08866 [Hirsutella rhossiliensis]